MHQVAGKHSSEPGEGSAPSTGGKGPRAPLTDAEKIARALAQAAYDTSSVRLVPHDLTDMSHLVATRSGLFAVNEQRHVLIAHGSFYGLTLRGDSIFAFEACDLAGLPTRRGRIVALERTGNRIATARVMVDGLDNGCHQIDFIDGRLTVLDSQRQRVLLLDAGEAAPEPVYPLGVLAERAWSKGYVHINSVAQIGEHILLLLHNGAAYTGQRSEVAMFDLRWREIVRWQLPGEGCHNLVVLEDGRLLSCGSVAGEIIDFDCALARLSDRMTRGLSVDASTIVVGASKFSARRGRETTAGAVMFLDRDYHVRSTIELPGAPTEIRRLDGRDLGLSSFRNALPPLFRAPA
jgi:hypothetical protein